MQLMQERPPYVQFEQREMGLDHAKSEEAGYPIARVVDMALITPAGSKDVIEKVAPEWIEQIRKQAMSGNYPAAWYQHFQLAYSEWQKGNEIPLNGTPIKTWPTVSKAQRDQILQAKILTVEDLANASESSLQSVGMGGRHYKDLAIEWLKQARIGADVAEVANLRKQNEELTQTVSRLNEQMQQMHAMLEGAGLAQKRGRRKTEELTE